MPLLLMMAKTTMITHDIVSRFMLTTMVMKWTSIEFLVYLLDFDTTDIIIRELVQSHWKPSVAYLRCANRHSH